MQGFEINSRAEIKSKNNKSYKKWKIMKSNRKEYRVLQFCLSMCVLSAMLVQNSGVYTLGEKVLFYFLIANVSNATRKSPVNL